MLFDVPRLLATVAVIFTALGTAQNASSQVSKGNQILINRGLQLQALSQDDCYLHLDTYSNANYTAIDWNNGPGVHSSRPEWMGSAPGFPWARWAADETQMPPQLTPNGGDETPFMGQFLGMQLGDEWNLNDDATRTRLVNWFNSVSANWPNAILYHNNWGTQIQDAQLGDFIARAHPDMLSFDTYPWQSVWTASHDGPPIGWNQPNSPLTGFYGDLRRYRAWARAYNIPFGIYRQTFHAIQDYNNTVYRDPSLSELRLNTSAGLAFNAKHFTDFMYNTGAGSLFTKTFNGSGDTQINTSNGLYNEMIDVNRRARNLGKALVLLTPILEMHNQNDTTPPPGVASGDPCACLIDGEVTSMMILRGRYLSGGVTNFTDLPNSFHNDPQGANANPASPGSVAYSWWEFTKNDPWWTGWTVTNKAGIRNDGLPGDVIVSWFKPLDESFDGAGYTNEIYVMVVNGLTATNGTAADCMQEIKMNFISSVPSSVILLDPETGLLQTNLMPIIPASGNRRQLTLDLNGGDAALFKFATGAPFVGHVPPAAARLSITHQPSGIVFGVQGTVGATYQLQKSPVFPATNWTSFSTLVLTSSPSVFVDPALSSASTSYYRAVGIP